MFRILLYCLLSASLLCGCSKRCITARSEALSCEYLASYYVETPDPTLSCGYTGQQIIIQWYLPPCLASKPELKVVLSMITANQQFRKEVFPIHTFWGYRTFRWTGEAFCQNGAILTFKVELFSGDLLLDSWRHQAWAEWIPS